MSSEFEDSDAGLQRDLQPAAPSDELGPNGLASARGAPPGSEAADPLPEASDAPTAEAGAPVPSPGAVRCSQCEADVVPTTPNHCPICGGWVFDNTGALVHGLRSKKVRAAVESFRVELLEQLFAERGGRESLDLVSRISVENYALACSQQKIVEAHIDEHGVFTQGGRRRPSYDMLIGLSAAIDRLRAQLPPLASRTRTSQYAGLDAMPTSALERSMDLVKRQLAGETLSDRELGQLDVLRGAMKGAITLPRDPINHAGPPRAAEGNASSAALDATVALAPEDGFVVILEPGDPGYEKQEAERETARAQSTTASPAASKTPTAAPRLCQTCYQTPDRCAAMKVEQPQRWDVVHRLDSAYAVEIEQREAERQKQEQEEAGAQMLRSLGRTYD